MTWADGLFAMSLAVLCVAGLLARRWMGGLNQLPPKSDRTRRP